MASPSEIFELEDERFSKDDRAVKRFTEVIDLHKRRWQIKAASNLRVSTPIYKRVMDVTAAGAGLLVASPLLLIIVIAMKLESWKAPIVYKSKRVGAGFRIFDLYKFRTMVPDADKKVAAVAHLNMYDQGQEIICEVCGSKPGACTGPTLFSDEGTEVCENMLLAQQKNKAAFLKVKNDPRITPLGKFMRNTSIDEIPQLWNILIGDMSLVGNRPLPLYEAEKLTTDDYSLRFMAPAGLTGLWQVSKRGKGDMSEAERIELDNKYAKTYNLWLDVQIILKTIPALLQSESV